MTNLSVPSVLLADAVWYGSLRGAVQMGGADDEARTIGGGSRWGIKGSSEVSEGLTAVYKFETRLDEDAAQSGNQIYAGLSGGFGSLTIGKFNNAAYLSGGIRDIGNAFGDSDVSSKVGNTVSYGFSTEAFSLQADAIMDNGTDTGKAIDEVQFGMTVNLGDIGKVALGYEKKEDSMMAGMAVEDLIMSALTSEAIPAAGLALNKDTGVVANIGSVAWRTSVAKGHKLVSGSVSDIVYTVGNTAGAKIVKVFHAGNDAPTGELTQRDDGSFTAGTCTSDAPCSNSSYVWVSTTYEEAAGVDKGEDPKTMHTIVTGTVSATATVTPTETNHGYKRSHISAAFGLGAVTVRLGHTSKDSNNPMMTAKAKTNFLGFTGSIGDTGMDWRAFGRNKEDHAGKETSPWGIGVGKALGGGAYTYIEHQNDDDGNSGRTQIGLNVDF